MRAARALPVAVPVETGCRIGRAREQRAADNVPVRLSVQSVTLLAGDRVRAAPGGFT